MALYITVSMTVGVASLIFVKVFIVCFVVPRSPSAAQCRASAPLHGLPRHELVSAVCWGRGLSARHEAEGLNSPGPQTTKVRLRRSLDPEDPGVMTVSISTPECPRLL